MGNEIPVKFEQIMPSIEAEGQVKELFDAATNALRRAEAVEIETDDLKLRKIIVLSSEDGNFEIVADVSIFMIKNEKDAEEIAGWANNPHPYLHVAWVNKDKKAGGSYVFIDKRIPYSVGNPIMIKDYFEKWNSGEILGNHFFFGGFRELLPRKEEIDLAIYTLKNGKFNPRLQEKCLDFLEESVGILKRMN